MLINRFVGWTVHERSAFRCNSRAVVLDNNYPFSEAPQMTSLFVAEIKGKSFSNDHRLSEKVRQALQKVIINVYSGCAILEIFSSSLTVQQLLADELFNLGPTLLVITEKMEELADRSEDWLSFYGLQFVTSSFGIAEPQSQTIQLNFWEKKMEFPTNDVIVTRAIREALTTNLVDIWYVRKGYRISNPRVEFRIHPDFVDLADNLFEYRGPEGFFIISRQNVIEIATKVLQKLVFHCEQQWPQDPYPIQNPTQLYRAYDHLPLAETNAKKIRVISCGCKPLSAYNWTVLQNTIYNSSALEFLLLRGATLDELEKVLFLLQNIPPEAPIRAYTIKDHGIQSTGKKFSSNTVYALVST